ncbi:MAG TPA: 6-phosphogluconolactonase [Candidatus Ozemobacteraceae bacterium]|nr:6-phosphogluconolactonase [Candidatus Ozemobacteraceae bacterium]
MSLVKRFGAPTAGAAAEIVPGGSDVAGWFADRIVATIETLASNLGRPPLIALSGGTTPEPIFERLARSHSDMVSRTIWCQTDERDVPPEHPDSNQGMICKTLFGATPGRRISNFIAVPLPAADPGSAVRQYTERLSGYLKKAGSASIDLVLLGIGEDGHTASLFPAADWSSISEPLFRAIEAPLPAGRRYTLSLPGLLSAHGLMFLVRGSSKAGIVKRILRDAPVDLPAGALVRAARTRWLLDASAASELR